MRTATRPGYERILVIHNATKRGEHPNASSVANRLEVAPRTIQRDIEFMRDRLKAPFEYVRARNGYRYTDPNYSLPSVFLTEGELIALVIAESVFRQYRRTPFTLDLERAFAKIQHGLPDRVSIDLDRLSECYDFRTAPELPFEESIFRALTKAVHERRRVEMTYWTASRDQETRRAVDPYGLTVVDSIWYMIGHCHWRSGLRTFAASRIRALDLTDTTFRVPPDFDLKGYLADSFGAIRSESGALFEVRVRFWGMAARYVGERVWHPSQTIETPAPGEIIVSLKVSHLLEVERWLLSWGSEAEVLAPEELRTRVAKQFRESSEIYAPKCGGSGIPSSESPSVPRPKRPKRSVDADR